MLTPQEVSERAFAKASFGGYNMAMVDEFLDALTGDYTALYKENAVLKSKMKVLVDKVEEYRATEDAMRKALLTAQRLADEMVQQAEEKTAVMLSQAEGEAKAKIAGLSQEIEAEAQRLVAAQNATTAYVARVKELCAQEVDYLNRLAQMTPPAPKPADPVMIAAQEIESSMHRMAEEEAPRPAVDDTLSFAPQAVREEAEPVGLYEEIAAEVQGQHKAMEETHFEVTLGQPKPEPQPERQPVPDDQPTRRIDFDHLQFGKDYEIK